MSRNLELRVVGEQTLHGAGCERTVEGTSSQVPGMRAVKGRGARAQDTEVNARRSPAASDPWTTLVVGRDGLVACRDDSAGTDEIPGPAVLEALTR